MWHLIPTGRHLPVLLSPIKPRLKEPRSCHGAYGAARRGCQPGLGNATGVVQAIRKARLLVGAATRTRHKCRPELGATPFAVRQEGGVSCVIGSVGTGCPRPPTHGRVACQRGSRGSVSCRMRLPNTRRRCSERDGHDRCGHGAAGGVRFENGKTPRLLHIRSPRPLMGGHGGRSTATEGVQRSAGTRASSLERLMRSVTSTRSLRRIGR
jgi:hypothetical protein